MFFITPLLLNAVSSDSKNLNNHPETSINIQDKIKVRGKRSLSDIEQKKYDGTGIGEEDLIHVNIDDKLKIDEDLKGKHQLLIEEQIKKLNNKFEQMENNSKELNVSWIYYDYKFETLLKRFRYIEDIRPYSSIKWHLSRGQNESYEVMNGDSKIAVTVNVDKNLEIYKSAFLYTKSFIKQNNGIHLAKFPGIRWQANPHYLPYVMTKWNTSIGTPGYFKSYMGPEFSFSYFVSTLNGKLENNFNKNLVFGVGLYYDTDRNDVEVIWKELKEANRLLLLDIQKFTDTFNDYKQEIELSKNLFQKSEELDKLELDKRISLLHKLYPENIFFKRITE